MDKVFLVFTVLGGLALFILGMNIMAEGLRRSAGKNLRKLLSRTSHRRLYGLGVGVFLGTLIHSSAATVMLVGFVNAGLMTLTGSIPPMLGANIGTTLSMQVISLHLADYCFVAIALGVGLRLVRPDTNAGHVGQVLLGFGLLFLGMDTMSHAIRPYREALSPVLATIDATDMVSMFTGIAIAAGLTAIIQSSGATIGMCFALISAGVFTDLRQVLPIVLGAHIGTCATALLGSIGTNIEARRCAAAHLLFNTFNVILAVLCAPYLLQFVPLTSSDLIHQTANLHTTVMVVAAFAMLPMTSVHAWIVRIVTPTKHPLPEPSHLDPDLLNRPEKAIYATIHELRRVARLCAENFRLNADQLLLHFDRKRIREAKLNERVINEIKTAMTDYLLEIPKRYLSKRQAILLQHVDRCMTDIERIGDHIDAIGDHSIERHVSGDIIIDKQSMSWLTELYQHAQRIVDQIIESLDPERTDFQHVARAIMDQREEFIDRSIHIKSVFTDKVERKEVSPTAGIFFMKYVSELERIVKHAQSIALAERHPLFWIKRKKLDRVAGEPPDFDVDEEQPHEDFVDRLQQDNYL